MLLDNLNNKQKEAVEYIGGPLLVFAGAGSGKTRVLTHKIAYLIEEVGLLPENILAVTFTNKAAQEMKARVVDLVNVNISGINIGTFHSISASILRKEIKHLGYNNDFTIYDQQDSKAVVKMVIKELNLDLKQYDPKTYQYKISSAKNLLQTTDYIEKSAVNVNDERFAQIYKRYQEILKTNNCVDFDDLIILPIKLFKDFPNRLEYYQNKFKYVLVDEYQDTNKPQFEFIHSVSYKHKDIFVVGDDDQSIYGWRGADISNILNFKEAFGEAEIIKLEQNYRSTKTILEAAWTVVSKNSNRAEKKLWTENVSGDKIKLISSYDERSEAKDILKSILEDKVDFKDISILYRTNSQSRPIEDELRRGGVPYQIIGGVKFYDRKEIKDILAYAKLIVNESDSISFNRSINFPIRGIGKTSIEKINQMANNANVSCMKIIQDVENLKVGLKQKKGIKEFNELISIYKQRSLKENGSIVIKDLLKDLNLKKYYEKQSTIEALDRWSNIEELITSMSEYEDNNEDKSLSKYLEEVSLLTDIDNWNSDNNSVTMMTIHSSKGLEFDCVYVCGLEDGLFPIIRLLEDNDFEEERRLFYVALTRAKVKSILSYAKSRRKFGGEPVITAMSRFVKEIPEELLDQPSYQIKKESRISLKTQNTNSNINISRGSTVEHKVFGRGKVLNVEGMGENSKITILFVNNVTKKFIFKYANLRIL